MLYVCGSRLLKRRLLKTLPTFTFLGLSLLSFGCQQGQINGGAVTLDSVLIGAQATPPPAGVAAATPSPITLGSVAPLYASAPQWNDFYIASSVTTVCSGTELNCKHGGELKKINVSGRSSCAGLTMTDQLGNFNWACDSSSGSVLFMGSIKPEKSLADLVSATSWKNNSVTINDGAQVMATTAPAAWWTNPVLALPDSSSAPVVLSASGTIYVAATSAVTQGYNINADKTSVAVLTGVTLTGTATVNTNASTFKATTPDTKAIISIGAQKFNSVEGSNNWIFGVKPTSGWTLDGNSLVDRVIMFGMTNYLRLKNLDLTNSNGYGMKGVSNLGFRISRLNLANSSTFGMGENTSLSGSFDRINGIDNRYQLFDFNGPSNITAQWIYSRNNSIQGAGDSNAAIWINGGNNLNFKNIELHTALCTAMTVRSTTNSIFDQMTLTDTGSGGTASCGVEGGNGLYIRNGSGLSFTNLKVVSNLGSGIRLNAPGLTSLKNVQVINNGLLSAYTGRAGIRETGIATGVVTYQNVIATNNAGEGLSIGYTGSVLSEILSTHNGSSGITINAAATSVTAATLAYNGAYGVNQSFKDAATTYHDLVAYKNTLAGIYFFDEAVGATLSQVVSQSNGGVGIQMAPPSVSGTARIKLVGNILVGANTGASCSIPGGTIGIADSSCTPSGTSTAVVKTNLAITGSFIEGTSSTQAFASITDFSNAAYSGKAWGRASPLTSACITGENCQLFDWALKSSDTVLMNKTGDAMTPNESFTAFGVCPVQTYGTVTDTKFTGSTAFLRNAIEDILVAGGNHNGLCETGETCIYTPNFGYYQGEGTYSPCAYQADGGINGVYLSGYSSNGH